MVHMLHRTLVLAVLLPFALRAQDPPAASAPAPTPADVVAQGKYRLHKFEQPIGEETFVITRSDGGLAVESKFKFTDRGMPVPLTATLRTAEDLTPRSFAIKGKVSRFANIDSSVEVTGKTAKVREGTETRDVAVSDRFFTISGYAPAAMQMLMVRYAVRHGVTGALATLPGGQVTIDKRGHDDIQVGDKKLALDRYSISGLIWGQETLWLDADQQLAALVSIDAEFDHFEAIRDDCESALPAFVSRAAEDGMAALAAMTGVGGAAEKGALAITHARLIDGTGSAPIDDATIVVDGARIAAVGPASKVKVPASARVIDAKGATVLPGLFDMHAHFEQVEWGPVYLAAGVTTARDCGNEFDFITAVRDSIAAGKGIGPRLLLAGIVDGDSRMALGIVRANDEEQAKAVVDRYHRAGFQQIKIYSSVKKPVVAAICAAAHALGMTVTGHIPNGMNALDGIAAGMDQINHIQYLPDILRDPATKPAPGAVPPPFDATTPAAQAAIATLKAHGTVLDPTLVIFEWSMHDSSQPFTAIEPGAAKVPHELDGALNNTGVPAAMAPRARAVMANYLAIVGALHQAGIPIVAGTDQVVPGHSLHRELELYVQAGFTPMEAIQSATLVPARAMKMDKDLGTVEAGKFADFILVDGDPLQDIANSRKVRTVIANGRVYDCGKLWASVGFKP
jgi:imidazolonepropionase-like amidohydrolase